MFTGKRSRRLSLLMLLGLIAVILFLLDQQQYRLLGIAQESFDQLRTWRESFPVLFIAGITVSYALLNVFFLPGGAIFVMLSGALFGPVWGILVATAGYVTGVGGGFLVARYLLHDYVTRTFPQKLERVNANVDKHGWVYVVVLRLVPLLPAPLVTLLMALTSLPLLTFLLATLFGRLPLTALYVNAGNQLTAIRSPSDVLSPEFLSALAAIAAFLLAGHFLAGRISLSKR